MDDPKKEIESLKKEVAELKIKLNRIEQYLLCLPKVNDYIHVGNDFNDGLFEEAKKVVQQYDRASASLIQRRLSIGYSRAARILDQLEAAGIVGHAEGSKPREVFKNVSKDKK